MAIRHGESRSQVGFEQGNPCFGPFGSRPLERLCNGEAISLRGKGIHEDRLNANRIPGREGVRQRVPQCFHSLFVDPRGFQGLRCTFGVMGLSEAESLPGGERLLGLLDHRPAFLPRPGLVTQESPEDKDPKNQRNDGDFEAKRERQEPFFDS